MAEEVTETIRDNHRLNLKGLLKAYPFNKIRESKSLKYSMRISLLYIFYVAVIGKQYNQISVISELFLEIFPSLLGFNLGGYAIIISFGNVSLLKSLTRKLKTRSYSLYQLISGIFAYSILLQATVLILTFIIHVFKSFPTPGIYSALVCSVINTLILFVYSFIGLYSLFQLPKMIINVFNFGQLHHFNLVKEGLKEKDDT